MQVWLLVYVTQFWLAAQAMDWTWFGACDLKRPWLTSTFQHTYITLASMSKAYLEGGWTQIRNTYIC